MAQLGINQTWTITVDSAELSLISRGLRNAIPTEEREAALKLADVLARHRAGQVKSALNSADKLLENVERANRKI